MLSLKTKVDTLLTQFFFSTLSTLPYNKKSVLSQSYLMHLQYCYFTKRLIEHNIKSTSSILIMRKQQNR